MSQTSPRRSSPTSLVLAGAALVLALWVASDRLLPGPLYDAGAEPRPVTPRGELADFERTTVEISERNAPSVVGVISPEVQIPGRRGYWKIPTGTGTGFVWNEDGYVVTNFHVVEGRRQVYVRTIDMENLTADVVGVAPEHDIAVLRVRANRDLPPVELGTSADLRVGQAVFAIGNPFGFDHSLSTGVISALQRSLPTESGVQLDGLIQVDAAINPGNSGGPLLDSAGRLIGMNTAIYSPTRTSAGIGFAVPVDTINRVVPQLIRGETVTKGSSDAASGRPGLGVVLELDPIRFRSGAVGLEIGEVVPGSGAEAAGLRGRTRDRYGDVIVSIDGQPTRSIEELTALLRRYEPGNSVRVEFVRGLPTGTRQSAEVTLQLLRD